MKPWEQYQSAGKPWEQYQEPVAPVEQPEIAQPETTAKTDQQAPTDPLSVLYGEILYPGAETLTKAVGNIPESGAAFLKNIYEAVRHPIDTAESLGKVITGGASKLAKFSREQGFPIAPEPTPEQMQQYGGYPEEKTAEAVGEFFVNRYGGAENIRKTIEQDPVGFLADASTVLMGGGAIASKIPKAGEFAKTTSQLGQAINPLTIAGKTVAPVAKAAGKGVSELVGLGTGTGGEALRRGFGAGAKGGETGEAFTSAMRSGAPMEEVVSSAKIALSNIRQARGQAYRSGMTNIAKDKTVLDFAPVDKAIKNIKQIGMYKGKPIAKSTAKVTQEIQKTINDWRKADPAQFHTPEGMDALKQAIGDIRDSTDFGTPSRLAADKAYQAIKGQITKQAPEYAKVMKDYETGTKLIKEIEKSLSLGEKATADTALRKLQSVLRDNVNTNYGRRGELAQKLSESGAPNLMEQLSGQSLSTLPPRGLSRLAASGFGGAGIATMNPAFALPILAQSPRLMGEAAYLGGQATGKISGAARQIEALLNRAHMSTKGAALGAYQAGQVKENQ